MQVYVSGMMKAFIIIFDNSIELPLFKILGVSTATFTNNRTITGKRIKTRNKNTIHL